MALTMRRVLSMIVILTNDIPVSGTLDLNFLLLFIQVKKKDLVLGLKNNTGLLR